MSYNPTRPRSAHVPDHRTQDHPQVPSASHVVVVPVPMDTMHQDPDHTLDPYPFPQAGLLFSRIFPKPSTLR